MRSPQFFQFRRTTVRKLRDVESQLLVVFEAREMVTLQTRAQAPHECVNYRTDDHLIHILTPDIRTKLDAVGKCESHLRLISRGGGARIGSFKATLEKLEVVVEDGGARASMLVTVVATTKDREKWMVLGRPDSGQPVELRLKLEGKRWRVVNATGLPQPR